MERNFLGLLNIKEEDTDASVQSGSARTRETGMQWSFSNVSGPSQHMSFWGSQEEGSRKNGHDLLVSSQRSSSSGSQLCDLIFKFLDTQKNVVLEKSVGTQYPIAAYPIQHLGVPSISRSHGMRMFPSSNLPNQAIKVSTSPSIVQTRVSTTGQNMISSQICPQPLGGVSALPAVSVLPSICSIIGSTDLRTGHKQHHGGPAQLTIFYAGSVSVYDDVSPEKAQAIMLLAGNGPPVAHHNPAPAPVAEVSTPFDKHVTVDGTNGKRTLSPAFLSLPGAVSVSTVSVSPQSVLPSQGNPICNLALATPKPSGPFDSPGATRQEPPKTIHSQESSSKPLFTSVALPQARKASLARFLEKRKERVASTSPYPIISCKSPENSTSNV